MKKTIVGIALGLILALGMTTQVLADKQGEDEGKYAKVGDKSTELVLTMTSTPAHPIIGDVVTWKVSAEGGQGPVRFTWNSVSLEFPALYNWTNVYPFYYMQSVSNVYSTAGDKTVQVAAESGAEWVERSLTMHVSEAVIKVTAPNANDVWQVGKTYEIKWSTRGQTDMVQIALIDSRYPTETGNTGETIIAQMIPNTGSYLYTVPQPVAGGISDGNIGEKNYHVTVRGWGDCVAGFTKPFTITTRGVSHGH